MKLLLNFGTRKKVPHLEQLALIVPLEIVCKDIGEHERPPALAEDVHSLLEELDLDPAHVVLLHLVHLFLKINETPC